MYVTVMTGIFVVVRVALFSGLVRRSAFFFCICTDLDFGLYLLSIGLVRADGGVANLNYSQRFGLH